jgi:hypothetical protein
MAANYYDTTIFKYNWWTSKIAQLINFQNQVHNAYSQKSKSKKSS